MRLPKPFHQALWLFLACALPILAGTPDLALIPQPAKISYQHGALKLSGPITVAPASEGPELKEAAALLYSAVAMDLGATAGPSHRPARATFLLLIDTKISGTEAYRLDITPRQARLAAPNAAGLFYGIQTLRQLLFQARATHALPCLRIEDQPRFSWRGMHLDVSRHFFPPAFIKRYLDVLALHKMNVFHWHLTDDHGWRIEIKAYPKLTSVGAWREPKDANAWIYAPERSMDPAKRTYGGFYTQDEVRDIVRYAAKRHIRVIPEIEMPAHSMAALDAYPELSCTGKPFVPPAVLNEQTEFTDPFCAGNEGTFTFLEGVLTEVMALFPDGDLHLGADEARKTSWQACPKCQARMKELGLKDEEALQSWFMKRMATFLAAHGKRAIGWDEMIQGGLPQGSLMMHWRSWLGDGAVIQATREGHDVVRTAADGLYFQPPATYKPSDTSGPGLPEYVQKILRFQPIPAVLNAREQRRILGVEACIWTEDLATEAQVMQSLLPALTPLAEVAWRGPGAGPAQFEPRLKPHLRFLDACGYEHAPLPATSDGTPKKR
jgi:hexosaminidase